MKALPRWGDGIVGQKKPEAVLEVRLNDEVLARAELFNREVDADGERLRLVGVGGVWTASKFRNQGLATALLVQSRELALKWGRDGVILFSLEPLVPFYEARGFKQHLGPVSMRQPNGIVSVPEEVAVLHIGRSWIDVEGELDIVGLPW